MKRARVLRDYRTQYAKPIHFAKGDIVSLGERDRQWPAFAWTTTADGNSGWAPFNWLRPLADGRAEALRDYSARELDAAASEVLTLHSELGGWWWAGHEDGRHGWVPADHLEPIE